VFHESHEASVSECRKSASAVCRNVLEDTRYNVVVVCLQVFYNYFVLTRAFQARAVH
jgi:hypothetical protein